MKLIEKHPVKTLEESRADMETKISRDERSRKIAESLNEKLRAKFPVKRNDAMYSKIKKAVTPAFYESTWETPKNLKAFSASLFSFAKQEVTGEKFLTYLSTQQKNPSQLKPVDKLVDFYYQNFVDAELNQFYNDDLENEFPEFAAVMDEYRDGLLLFDLMEKEIWEKSKTDTLGLEGFYVQNMNKYQWKKRYDVVILSSTKDDMAKKAYKLLKKGKTIEEIKKELNMQDVVNIMTTSGVFEEDNSVLPKNVKYEKGLQNVVKEENYYYVVQVNGVQEAGPKTLAEAKGRVVNDYQQFLEENWVGKLKQEFKVNVDQAVFSDVKMQLKK
jgi:peptidyl-prolyl cis-trans isomerase SurA